MSEEQKQQILKQTLWNIANDLRGNMDADDFRDYILGFIFYKYLSRKMELYANVILKPDGLDYDTVETHPEAEALLEAIKFEALDKLGYFLKPSELFSELAKRGNSGNKNNFILGDLANVLTNIEQSTMGSESEEDFGHLFEDLDLTSQKLGKTEDAKNELIVKVLTHLEGIDFDLENTDSDILGDAYEYLIGQFASGAGKKAGEFYTPQQVSKILAQLVTTGKTKLKSVYDPTCGSGSLLLRVAKEVGDVGEFFGQESNPTTYNLCRMNMIMHDVHYKRFDIYNEDTLVNPSPNHIDKRFEAIVANPPFSANWSASPLFMSDDRFSAYGKLAPKSKADFAFVQHMVHQLDDNGTMACVLPHGVLFRGAAEGHIRKFLIEDKNYLDAVIGLPANIFYGTSIPTCILVLKKNRTEDVTLSAVEGQSKLNPRHSELVSESQSNNNANSETKSHAELVEAPKRHESILFIDASQHFEKVKTQNVLQDAHIDKIIETYRAYCHTERSRSATIDKYSYVATLAEVKENDYNLNIPRYVDTFEEEEPIDLTTVAKDLKALDKDIKKTDATIADFCKQLNIDTPF